MDSKERLRLRHAAAAVIAEEVTKVAVSIYREHALGMIEAFEQAERNWAGHDDKGIEQIVRESDWSETYEYIMGLVLCQGSEEAAEYMAKTMALDVAPSATYRAIIEVYGQY